MASNRFSRLVKILTGTDSDPDDELLQLEGKVERTAHFWTLVVKSFNRNRGFIRASSLAYTTLLALIPLLAVVVSVTSSLLKTQGEDEIYRAIDKFVSTVMPPATTLTSSNGVALHLNPDVTVPLLSSNLAVATNFIPQVTNLPVIKSHLHGPVKKILETNSAVVLASTNAIGGTNLVVFFTNAPAADARVVIAQKDAAKSIHDYIQNARSGTLGLTGMIVFVFIAITMLSRVEDTFNDIWGVVRGRTWVWRVVLYWATITLGPLVLITALGLSGSSHFQNAKNFVSGTHILGNFILQLLPVVVLWFTFTLIYMLVPNTRVKFSAAFAGGAIAGTLWHLNNVFGFLYVSRLATNTNIYGSIGLVPVFMLGLYFSWVILLFGAQVAYAFQNRAAYLQDKLADNVNQRGREFVALRIMTMLGQRFQNGLKPATVIHMATELGVPSRLIQQVLRTLGSANLVIEVGGAEAGHVPARPLDSINAHHILLAMRSGAGRELPVDGAPDLVEIYGEFARIEDAERIAAEKISLLALVNHLPLPTVLAGPGDRKIQITDARPDRETQSRPLELEPPAAPEKSATPEISPGKKTRPARSRKI